MITSLPGKRQVSRIVEQILSSQRDQRIEGIQALRSLSDDERLIAEEAVATSISWDSKPGLIAIAFVSLIVTILVSFNPLYFVGWICVFSGAVLIYRLMQRHHQVRDETLSAVLQGTTDKRLIPELLACRSRIGARWGASSQRYRTLIETLERLFPMVTQADVGNLHHCTHMALMFFLTVPPHHPLLTLEVLRLAPAFGDSKVLDCIDQLAEHHEWGGAVSADLCFQLHTAAVTAQAGLRSAIELRAQSSGLLRASHVPERQDQAELLRSVTAANEIPDSELLRPEQPADFGASEVFDAYPPVATATRIYVPTDTSGVTELQSKIVASTGSDSCS